MTLTEDEIRPDYLKDGQVERFANDIRRLLERRSEFAEVLCPACASKRFEKRFEKYGLCYVDCCDCETMYVNPRPTPNILDWYYSNSENYKYWAKYIFPASENARREKIFRPRANRVADICARYGVGAGVLLEVGAGFGTFCEEAQRLALFQRVIAVEPTPDPAAACRKKGLHVIEKPIEHLTFDKGTIDVVVSFEVIEHLFSPRDFTLKCHSILRTGGLLVLTCPSVKGFDVVVLQEVSDTVDVEHLNYFHPRSLSRLLRESGFDILEVLTPGELDAELVRKKALAGDCDLSNQPFLEQVLIRDWNGLGEPFQQFLADNLLSSHMWIVARKL